MALLGTFNDRALEGVNYWFTIMDENTVCSLYIVCLFVIPVCPSLFLFLGSFIHWALEGVNYWFRIVDENTVCSLYNLCLSVHHCRPFVGHIYT